MQDNTTKTLNLGTAWEEVIDRPAYAAALVAFEREETPNTEGTHHKIYALKPSDLAKAGKAILRQAAIDNGLSEEAAKELELTYAANGIKDTIEAKLANLSNTNGETFDDLTVRTGVQHEGVDEETFYFGTRANLESLGFTIDEENNRAIPPAPGGNAVG